MGSGLSASNRVSESLNNSSEFNSACDSVYTECLELSQHAFAGVRPYQLASASDRLYRSLTTVHPIPLILKWVPLPPTESQVDRALRVISGGVAGETTLGQVQFKAFAVELFSNAVVSNAGKALLQRVPIGVAGIAGVGMATRSGKELIGTAIGVYAVGVATAVYFSLLG